MLDICAAAVFNAFFTSKGPEIELFARLKSYWDFIDEAGGGSFLSDLDNVWLESRRAVVVNSLRRHLEDVQPREDYREFIRLTLWLLGELEDIGTGFCAPGAYRRARWMA